MSPKKTETEAPAEAQRSRRLLVMGLVAVLAVAGAAYFFLVAGGRADAAEPVPGEVLALDSVAVNLSGGGYLQVGIALQLTDQAGGGKHGGSGVDGSKALDLVISTFSQAAPADVAGAREALKESLEQRIVEAYTEDGAALVMGIYFTEYVTQ